MALKRATYKVEFSFNDLSLAEQDRLYRKLYSILDFDLKDRMAINVTDLLGGQHDVFLNKGVRPDGVACEKCGDVDCARCKIWKRAQELKEENNN
jgi:hypothetical protein